MISVCMKRSFLHTPLMMAAMVILGGCATGTKLAEGEYNLVRNRISVSSREPAPSELTSYVKQQPGSFSITGRKPVAFSDRLMQSSVESLKDHMRYLGYYNSTVEADVRYKGRKAYATYSITPGERLRIHELRYSLPERGTFAEDFLSDTANVTIHPGDILAEDILEKESERSAAVMRTKGYYGFTKNYYFFEADTLSGPDSVVLEMRVAEYTRNELPSNAKPLQRAEISAVTLSHSRALPFKDRILRELNTVKPGTMYDESVINTTYQRLSALRVFNSVAVEMSPVDSTHVRCDINLSESRVQGFKVELEASTNSSGLMGVSPQLTYHHKNIFHGGEWLNLSFLGNFQFMFGNKTSSNEVGVSAGLSLPRFLGLPYSFFKGPYIPRTEINASYSYQDRPEYNRTMISTSYGYSGTMLHGKAQYQMYPLQVSIVRLFKLDDEFYKSLESNPFMRYSYQNHFDAGVGGTWYYQDPSVNGSRYIRVGTDLSGNVLSLLKGVMKKDSDGAGLIWGAPFAQYVKGEVNMGRTWNLGRSEKHAIATRFVAGAGYAYGNSTALPFEKQFYCGGANSMRGWQARALGPGHSPRSTSFSIPSQTGDIKLEANLEYRFNLVWKLKGAVFGDVGNVWNWDFDDPSACFGKDFYKSLAADWGLGLRCDLNFLVVRIDMGFKLYDPTYSTTIDGESGLPVQLPYGLRTPSEWLKRDGFGLHFGVGYPF